MKHSPDEKIVLKKKMFLPREEIVRESIELINIKL